MLNIERSPSTNSTRARLSMAARRRALLRLGEEELALILALPEGASLCGVHDDFVRSGVMVLLEGDMFPLCAEGTEPWQVPVTLMREDGRVKVIFEFPEV